MSSNNNDGMPFSTHDRDNDNSNKHSVSGGNCADYHDVGWWYNDCYCSVLNRPYYTNSYMLHWRTFCRYLKCSEMKLCSRDSHIKQHYTH